MTTDSVRLPDGTVVVLRNVTSMSDKDKLQVIQAILDRKDAEDADKYENSSGYCWDKIETVLGFASPEGSRP